MIQSERKIEVEQKIETDRQKKRENTNKIYFKIFL